MKKERIWLVKAEWRSTKLDFKVRAANEKQAWHRGWGQVSRMEGGDSCLQVIVVREVR